MNYKLTCTFTFFLLTFSLSHGQYFEKETIGYTFYDLQSSGSTQNRLHVFEDGTIGAVWTMGFDFENYFMYDRGTGYNYYDGSFWQELPTERIEELRTGWPCYAPWGQNGEIVVSHIVDPGNIDGLMLSYRSQKGEGIWSHSILEHNLPGYPAGLPYPRMITNGSNNEIIHILTGTVPGYPPQGQNHPLLYYRSLTYGQTWDIEQYIFPELDDTYYLNIPLDCYAWAKPKGNTIAFIVGNKEMDLVLMKSTNNGDTWQKTIVWEHPYPFLCDTTVADTFFCNNGSMSVIMDNNNKVHIAFGIDRWKPDENQNIDTLFADGIAYWNEDMPVFANSLNALHPDTLMVTGNLIGWMQDIDNNGVISLLDDIVYYRSQGMSSMPTLAIDENDHIYLVFSSVTESYDNGLYNYRHVWFRRSPDNGQTWDDFIDINGGLIGYLNENVFPSLFYNNGHLDLIFQQDPEPGLAIQWQYHPYIENVIKYVNLDDYVFPQTTMHENKSVPVISVSPNPASGMVRISGEFKNPCSVKIVDLAGKIILNQSVYQKSKVVWLDLTGIPAGIYILKFISGDNRFTQKLVIKN